MSINKPQVGFGIMQCTFDEKRTNFAQQKGGGLTEIATDAN